MAKAPDSVRRRVFVARFIDDEGDFAPDEALERSAGSMLDEMVRVQAALAVLRDGAL